MAMLARVGSLQAGTCLSPPCWRALLETWHCSGLARPCSCASASDKGQKAAASLFQAVFPSQGHVRACRAALVPW